MPAGSHKHLTPTLAAKPVGLLTTRELARLARQLARRRDEAGDAGAAGQGDEGRAQSCERGAILELQIATPGATGSPAWPSTSPRATRSDLTDDQVAAVVAAAYAVDRAFGLYVETAAVTRRGLRHKSPG